MNSNIYNSFYYNNALKINLDRILHLKSLNLNLKDKIILETGCVLHNIRISK